MKVSYDRDPKWNLCSVNVPRNFRELTKKYIEELSDNKIKDNHKTINILHFDNMGNLWHGNKEDNCYPIKTNRLAIVRYLVENSKGEEYQQTELIALAVGKKKEYVMREIGKIIDRIDTKLGLPDVIENMRGSGYRINPIYRIAPVNN